MTHFYRMSIAAFVTLVAATSSPEAACGDRGGPGCRGPDGKCVSWEALGRICGSPPSTRCTCEKIAPDADDAAGKGQDIQEQKKRQHELRNKKQNRVDEWQTRTRALHACADQARLARNAMVRAAMVKLNDRATISMRRSTIVEESK
jgi:hypothetical protein